MNIKAEQLEKDIDAIPGVCSDAKKAIKKLFENNFAVKFKPEINPNIGEVWAWEMDERLIVEDCRNSLWTVVDLIREHKAKILYAGDTYPCTREKLVEIMISAKAKKLADTLEEYYANKKK